MNTQVNYETDGFEFEPEADQFEELDESSGRGGCRCSCGGRFAELDATEQEYDSGELSLLPASWLNPLYRLYRAGRLGWKAGRFIDKLSGKVFGKPISKIGADYLYRKLGRSRRLEDFFDNLPPRVKRWLNQF